MLFCDGNLLSKVKPDGSATLYLGGLYEVDLTSSGVTTKKTTYYPGGAMRVDIVGGANTLYYSLRDHLGSASVLLDSSGNPVTNGEQRYYPFGENRITSADLKTDHLFTGQLSVGLGGIYHYGARFYSSRLGRFIQADTIVPNFADPQSLNRFSYGYNNPVKYIDPTGHTAICGAGCEEELDNNWSAPLSSYGVTTTGLNSLEQLAIMAAVQDVGQLLADTTPWLDTPAEAFQGTFGLDSGNQMEFARCPEGVCTAVGLTESSTSILFNRFDNVYQTDDIGTAWEKTVHLVGHELGHAFNGRLTNVVGERQSPYTQLFRTQANDPTFPNREGAANLTFGFAGPRWNWQQSNDSRYFEEFADMFLDWTYNRWEADVDGLTAAGQARADWMAARMPLWVNAAGAREEDSR